KERIAHLLNAYKSVNDLNTIASIKETTKIDIYQQFHQTDDTLTEAIEKLMNIRITKVQVDKILETLQTYVIPFEHPPKKQFVKLKSLNHRLLVMKFYWKVLISDGTISLQTENLSSIITSKEL